MPLISLPDLSRNNISTILANNFRGQDGLHELDLSFNKIQEISSWTFQHLKVQKKKQPRIVHTFQTCSFFVVKYLNCELATTISSCSIPNSFCVFMIFFSISFWHKFYLFCYQYIRVGFETPEFGWKFNSWIGATRILHAWQTQIFESKWKSIERFAAGRF